MAPSHFTSPAGSTHVIDYAAEGGPRVELRVQALFGLGEHPVIGTARVPLVLSLTSPAGRPIQTTRDLPGFGRAAGVQWPEMRGRYPAIPGPTHPQRPPRRCARKGGCKSRRFAIRDRYYGHCSHLPAPQERDAIRQVPDRSLATRIRTDRGEKPDPLTGWAGSGDTQEQVRLTFATLEEAIAYCQREGLDHHVVPTPQKTLKLQSYADNFR